MLELRKAGFPTPSQIQMYTWPLALEKRDVIGIAATGSGKTLAFFVLSSSSPKNPVISKYGFRALSQESFRYVLWQFL